jgi:hypothetical protein
MLIPKRLGINQLGEFSAVREEADEITIRFRAEAYLSV